MSKKLSKKQLSRRSFVQSVAGASVAGAFASPLIASPLIITTSRTSEEIILGQGAHRFKVDHDFVQLPNQYSWQITHNVAVDKSNNVYVIHEGDANKKDHPSIFVFDETGKFIRAFGKEFQGGGHGLEIREENGEQFLYVTAYQALKLLAKLTLRGENVWTQKAPMASGLYAKDEDKNGNGEWGRNRFMPTNICFLSDGGFMVADGYGAYAIHRYDANAKYVSTFGTAGSEKGQLNLPHGVWIDRRDEALGEQVVVADRANNRLHWFSLEGKLLRTQDDFLLPANVDTRGELMLVPELQARLTLLDRDNQVVSVLGKDPEWRKKVLADRLALRSNPAGWKDGKFLHPHDACFDLEGNIYVAEWVSTGRITRLTRV